eukprot:TRINITY_DN73966_c0_g1_i1.p1 TRINITY_DN73966_c0_g1~~TRINITY_DN73966_c0_g1_i1.p1  ORF type:complete len:566 (+),score=215.81 TRINITY_DN73966_c0_g1_i1:52-1698(+)
MPLMPVMLLLLPTLTAGVRVIPPPQPKGFPSSKVADASQHPKLEYMSTYSNLPAAEYLCAADGVIGIVSPAGGSQNSVVVLDILANGSLSETSYSPLLLDGFGVPNSCYAKSGLLAVAVQNGVNMTHNGKVFFYNITTGAKIDDVDVGPLPDHVSSPDGKTFVSANEGEPEKWDNGDGIFHDPYGGVSIMWQKGSKFETCTISFEGLTKRRCKRPSTELYKRNKVHKALPSAKNFEVDFEPEFISYDPQDPTKAYVVMQEANTVMVVDIRQHYRRCDTSRILAFHPLGWKDWTLPENKLDASDKNGVTVFKNEPVYSMYQPDTIKSFVVDGVTYFVTANEGDSKAKGEGDWEDGEEERGDDLKISGAFKLGSYYTSAAEMQKEENLGRMKVTTMEGDVDGDGMYEALVGYGGRGFAVWRFGTRTTELVYESGSLVSEAAFNYSEANGGDLYSTKREDDKGVEPEGMDVATINGSPVLFLGLERAKMLCTFDLANPSLPSFIECVHNPTGGMEKPEAIQFLKENPTGSPLLLVTGEGSKDLTLWKVLNA